MATHDYDIANQSGASFRADLNNALAAIVSQNSSATEPATKFAYQYWVDTSASPALIKQRNAANDGWITLAEVNGQLLAKDGTVSKPGISFRNDTDCGLQRNSDDKISLVTNGVSRLTCGTSGKVGIGHTSPNSTLHCENTPNADIQITGGPSGTATLKLGDTDDANIGKIQYKNSNNSLSFDTNNSTKLTILSDGKCGIGETTPTELLHVAGNIKTTGSIDIASGNIFNGTPAIGTSGFDLQDVGVHKLARDTAVGNSVLKVMGGSGELRVKGDGDCENSNGNYDQISSDERLKENIVDASSQWEDIKGIRFRNFNYISNPNTRMLGCVAQELQQVCPSLIKTRPASEEEIADNSNTISQGDQVLSFKQIPLLFKSAKALQEAMERIETLEAKVAALEGGN